VNARKKIEEMTIDGTTGNGVVCQTRDTSKKVEALRIRAAALVNTRASPGLQVSSGT
jgi:DNA-binding protein YbaB